MGAQNTATPKWSELTQPTTVGVISRISYFRDCLLAGLSRELEVLPIDLLDGSGETFRRIANLRPDVVLLDITSQLALEVIRRIRDEWLSTRIVVLGVDGDEDQIVALAEAGIAGFVPRDGSMGDLINSVECALRDELLCSPRTAARMARRLWALAGQSGAQRRNRAVTPREAQIVGCIDHGLSNKEIAVQLGIELSTVKNHVHNILEKLAVHRRGQAAAHLAGRSEG
jgi:DNA-binding NarL/FixJ family response regulator